MQEQLKSLIAAGRTEKALTLLATTDNNDAILQQSRYNNGKKEYDLGITDFGEWSRLQNQVSHALLELANSLPDSNNSNSNSNNLMTISGAPIAYRGPVTEPFTVQELPLQVEQFLETKISPLVPADWFAKANRLIQAHEGTVKAKGDRTARIQLACLLIELEEPDAGTEANVREFLSGQIAEYIAIRDLQALLQNAGKFNWLTASVEEIKKQVKAWAKENPMGKDRAIALQEAVEFTLDNAVLNKIVRESLKAHCG